MAQEPAVREITIGDGKEPSRLIARGEAEVVILGKPPRERGNGPKGRPVHADMPTPHPSDPEGKSAHTWEKQQAAQRKIEVLVVATPMEGFAQYYCAKRPWPRGQTRTMVSPAELEELQNEEGRISVVLADDMGKQSVVPAQVFGSSGEKLTPEVDALPKIDEPSPPPSSPRAQKKK